jgi:arginase
MSTRPRFAIVDAPSVLGLFPRGVERLGESLLDAGLAQRLDARHAGRVVPPPYVEAIDPTLRIRNAREIADYARTLADAVQAVHARGEFPIVLGGDCSNVLGCLLAQRRRGRAGLMFIDGHADFYQPEAEPNGEAASMDLALATGRGPAVITNIGGSGPLVRDDDVVVFARRDAEDAEEHGSQRIEDTAIEVIDLCELRRDGLSRSLDRVRSRLLRDDLDGFWIHLDADALDDAIMPAVDYRMPGGLAWRELSAVLTDAVASGRALGIDIAIFNPSLDADGSIAKRFVNALVEGLTGRARLEA